MLEKRLRHISDPVSNGSTYQRLDNNNNNDINRSSQHINNDVRHEYDYNSLSIPTHYLGYNCDSIDEEDEFRINTSAVLQHYIIVWVSILTSPKGNFYKQS